MSNFSFIPKRISKLDLPIDDDANRNGQNSIMLVTKHGTVCARRCFAVYEIIIAQFHSRLRLIRLPFINGAFLLEKERHYDDLLDYLPIAKISIDDRIF